MRWADVGFYFQVDIFTFWLALGIIIFWAALWMLHALSITYGTWRLYRKVDSMSSCSDCGVVGRGSGEGGHSPGVSILKPLVGNGDPNLFSNLETFFTQNYPKFELLFCVHSEDDPSLSIVETLLKKYPSVDCRVFKGGQNVGINPKINNMMPGYVNSKYDLILISDSGIRMKEDTLSDMVNHMTDRVGMITQMPFVCDRNTTFANTLEKVFFGAYHARMYLAADAAGVLCPTGMSSMMRKQILEECGGLQTYGKYIAEDYFMGQSVVKKGWKCTISGQPAWQNHGCATVKSFHLRVARWAKLRIAMLPHTILLEPIQECVVNGLLAGWAVNCLFEWNSLLFFLIHLQFWMLLDYALLRIVQNGPLPFGRFEFAVSWLYRELSALPTFLYALLRPEIRWRDSGSYKLDWGGLARKVRDGAGNKIPHYQHAQSSISTSTKQPHEKRSSTTSKSSSSQIVDMMRGGVGGGDWDSSCLDYPSSPHQLPPPPYSLVAAHHQQHSSLSTNTNTKNINSINCVSNSYYSSHLNNNNCGGGPPLFNHVQNQSPTKPSSPFPLQQQLVSSSSSSSAHSSKSGAAATMATSPLSIKSTILQSHQYVDSSSFGSAAAAAVVPQVTKNCSIDVIPLSSSAAKTTTRTAERDADDQADTEGTIVNITTDITPYQQVVDGRRGGDRQSFQTHSRTPSLRSQSEII